MLGLILNFCKVGIHCITKCVDIRRHWVDAWISALGKFVSRILWIGWKIVRFGLESLHVQTQNRNRTRHLSTRVRSSNLYFILFLLLEVVISPSRKDVSVTVKKNALVVSPDHEAITGYISSSQKYFDVFAS